MRSLSKRFLAVFSLSFVVAMLPIFAQTENTEKKFETWSDIVRHMEVHLNKAYELYTQGKNKEAYAEVNTAYFRYYESKGMEKITAGYISGERKTAIETAFYQYRRNVKSDKNAQEVKEHKDLLINMLRRDAAELDGVSPEENSVSGAIATFIASLTLLLREGLEAILVLAAILTYLIKTDRKKYNKFIYIGAIAGVVFSIIFAAVLSMFTAAQTGFVQELMEGIGMFLAVVVLYYVSNWMISKAEVEAWNKYIKRKVEASVSTGNMWVLIFTAFIAVAREGAELILFFQGIVINGTNGYIAMWSAIVIGSVLLLAIFLVFRYFTVKLPLKPFFIFTSFLMYIFCFSFTGKGMAEMQGSGLVPYTPISWMNGFSIDLLGIYPAYETLIPQIIVLIIIVVTIGWYFQKNKKIHKELVAQTQDSSSSQE